MRRADAGVGMRIVPTRRCEVSELKLCRAAGLQLAKSVGESDNMSANASVEKRACTHVGREVG